MKHQNKISPLTFRVTKPEVIREKLSLIHMSKAEFSRITGISEPTIRDFLNNKTNLSIALRRLIDYDISVVITDFIANNKRYTQKAKQMIIGRCKVLDKDPNSKDEIIIYRR